MPGVLAPTWFKIHLTDLCLGTRAGQLYAMAAPLLFPHVPEWGGLGAAPFSGIASRELLYTLKRRQKGAFVLRRVRRQEQVQAGR